MAATQEDLARLLVQVELSQAKVEKQAAAIARAAEKSAKQTESAYKAANSNVASGFQQTGAQVTTSLRAQQQAAKNLGFQLNDIATQLASGTSPFRVLAQQGGQIVQILNETGGARGAIGALAGSFGSLLNPIGLATIAIGTLGAAALTYFTSSEEEGEKNNKTLDEHRAKIQAALEAWGSSAPQAVIDYANALERIAEVNKKLEALNLTRDKLTEPFRGAKDDIQIELANIQMILQDFGVDGAKISNDLGEKWSALAKAIAENKDPTQEIAALVAELGRAAQFTGSNVSDSLVKSLQQLGEVAAGTKDQLEGVNSSIERLNNNAIQSINSLRLPEQLTPLTSGAGVFNPSQTQLEQAEAAKKEAEQAAKEAQRAAEQARKNATREAQRAAKEAADRLSRAVANQTSVAVDAATAYLGQRETTNRGSINAFLQAGGVDLDAATTAWCAAFVNSALAQVGVKGSGSNVATDFLNWGTTINPSQVQRGDVLVQDRGLSAGQTGGHVGFATGLVRFQEGILQLQMLSGNASNKVSEDWINATDVVAKRATDAVQVSADALQHITDGSKAALEQQKQALQDQQQAYEQLGQIATTALNGIANALADGKIEGHELLQILIQIIQQMLTMPKGGLGGLFGGGGGGLLGGFLIPGILHKGGVAGSDGYGHGRAVSPSVFAGAKRYHSGGVAGLQPGEVPAILQRGEVVLPRGAGMSSGSNINVTVGVSANNNGNLMPFVESVSKSTVRQAAPAIIQASTKNVAKNFPGMMANAQARTG